MLKNLYFYLFLLVRGTIVNRTYAEHTKTHMFTYFCRQHLVLGPMARTKPIYLPIFTDNVWSYLLWPPVIAIFGPIYYAPP